MITDLTKHAPRSPKEKLGGIVALPRFIDKARANVAGTLGEYKLGVGSAVDQRLIEFLGIDLLSFLQKVQVGADDNVLLGWVLEHGKHPIDGEIKAWSERFLNLLAKDDPDRQQYIKIVLEKTGLDPKTTTTFDWLEYDDLQSFQ